ncbi:helix-turn-helix domain containing protein [Fodinisporobacter ferrooxydans]|uniref:Helix-turn-helix domain containing protein n=1 Tax=Fodinisporobacter ferrooxydans TaxID=2901836 RepID=A0ABY4CJX6_9BACL|nr:helix-turn-helix domain containing protein [Alicyclobacillaceae bacterium MYW30-H2]
MTNAVAERKTSKRASGYHQDPVKLIATSHMTQERKQLYIALEDMDFIWDMKDIERVERMWEDGISIQAMSRRLDRDTDEIAVLIIDRVRKEKIKPRREGVFGNRG